MKARIVKTGEIIEVKCLYPITYSRLDCNGKIMEEYDEDELEFITNNDTSQSVANIIANTKIIHGRYKACINNSINTFEQAEKNFIEKLIAEIDVKLQEYMDNHKQVDFNKDVKGHYYDVESLVIYDEWPEFKKYLEFIDCSYYNIGEKLTSFMSKSLRKYGFPTENIFDYYNNGWLRYKLMDFRAKGGGLTIGENYEDYKNDN
jgi:hypothetical protein